MGVVMINVCVMNIVMVIDVDVCVVVIKITCTTSETVVPTPAVSPIAQGSPHEDACGKIPDTVAPAVSHQYCRICWLDICRFWVYGS